ncbi:alpha/beta hydrolase [Agarivorans sp. Alg241-V36]|uniref:alpha/beta hydrolase n=1 Tax=Agarivorans sp. Alg241-V36 TaxID=2305992 RepID=UPI0013D4B97A|nr:alpha/beta hydrolase [Agarivorans sp. Alg241-V36]
MLNVNKIKSAVLVAGVGLAMISPSLVASTAKPSPTEPSKLIRNTPTPVGVSAKMASIIENRQFAEAELEAPTSTEQWLELQQLWNKGSAELASQLADKLALSYEKKAIAGVNTFVVTPDNIDSRYADRYFMHLHGGAFVFGGEESALREAMWVANGLNVKVISVDYRQPPLHPFPAAIDDAVAVWTEITRKQPANKTAIFGSSAGGNLTLTTTLRLKELGLDLPGALFAGTPATDLAHTTDTWHTLKGLDALGSREGVIDGTFEVYVPSGDLENPLVSPVYADLEGFPPTLLISGTRDLLLSDTVRMHRALRAANVNADLHIYDGQSHGDYMMGLLYDLPESDDALAELGSFFDTHLN